jgi:hypothetical protein
MHSFLRGGRRRPDGANQDRSQLEGGVMALEAGKDILRHPPGNRSPFCLQEVVDGGLQVSQPLGGGVQHREGGAK